MLGLTSFRRAIILGIGSLMLTGVFFSNARCTHAKLHYLACHRPPANETDGIRGDLKQPRSTLCLACHDAALDVSGLNPPHVVNGSQDLAGGSFTPILFSDSAGHNIQTIDAALGLTPPGGVSLSEFNCLSCHNPHTNGNYRNLKKEINGPATLVKADGDPNFQKNAYISGMNDFCGACHAGFNSVHNIGGVSGWDCHPVGITIYGSQPVDFEHWSGLKNKITQAELPLGNPNDLYSAQVFCLTCHRAHASPYKDSMRWDYSKNPQGCLECQMF